MKRKLKGEHLTLEMKSLLVHSDGECAVVLVIDADHSALVREREGGGGEVTGRVIFYFPFPSLCPPHAPANNPCPRLPVLCLST